MEETDAFAHMKRRVKHRKKEDVIIFRITTVSGSIDAARILLKTKKQHLLFGDGETSNVEEPEILLDYVVLSNQLRVANPPIKVFKKTLGALSPEEYLRNYYKQVTV